LFTIRTSYPDVLPFPRPLSLRPGFNPGVEIVHVIAKNFNPVNRAEFNPGVESSPCNRPLKIATSLSAIGSFFYGHQCRYSASNRLLGMQIMQLPEKYKENVDVSSEDSSSGS
jgi:hypothetical protein